MHLCSLTQKKGVASLSLHTTTIQPTALWQDTVRYFQLLPKINPSTAAYLLEVPITTIIYIRALSALLLLFRTSTLLGRPLSTSSQLNQFELASLLFFGLVSRSGLFIESKERI
jgi:hypothetical protein